MNNKTQPDYVLRASTNLVGVTPSKETPEQTTTVLCVPIERAKLGAGVTIDYMPHRVLRSIWEQTYAEITRVLDVLTQTFKDEVHPDYTHIHVTPETVAGITTEMGKFYHIVSRFANEIKKPVPIHDTLGERTVTYGVRIDPTFASEIDTLISTAYRELRWVHDENDYESVQHITRDALKQTEEQLNQTIQNYTNALYEG